jgi:hypothetical protein
MSITVRQWKTEELENLSKDGWLATVFMNKSTFSGEQIQFYPYITRREYLAILNNSAGNDVITFYAVDDENALRFIREEYEPSCIKSVERVIREYVTILKNY